MSNRQPPRPQRFQLYKELPDGSGFTIAGSHHIFKFDRYGGWFDQYGNYYNQNGSATDPPSDEDPYSDHSPSKSNHSEDDYDEFQKQFGPANNYEEDDYQPNLIHYGRVAINLQILNSYPSNQPFRVNFKNIPYLSNKEQVYKYFKDRVSGILNLIFKYNEKGQFNGTGYFVVENFKAGQELIKLEGEKVGDREIKFDLEEVDHLLLDPIKPNQLLPEFLSKNIEKKFYNSALSNNQQSKPIQQLNKEPKQVDKTKLPETQPIKQVKQPETKPIKKFVPKSSEQKKEAAKLTEVSKKQQSKPVEEQKHSTQTKVQKETTPSKNQSTTSEQYATYRFVRVHFPKKSSLHQWAVDNHFDILDVKSIDKIEGDDIHAKVTMKRKIYDKLNNTKYEGALIEFIPL